MKMMQMIAIMWLGLFFLGISFCFPVQQKWNVLWAIPATIAAFPALLLGAWAGFRLLGIK